MSKYKCHKIVDAHQVAYIEEQPAGMCLGFDGGYPMMTADPKMTERFKPGYGDYLVIYEDGYKSFSPKDVFEAGYHPVVEGVDTIPESITPDMLEAKVVSSEYFNSELMTVCVIKLENGFQVIGKSACANPEIYDEQKGKEIARADAVNQIWQLEGYLLKQRMFEAE